MIKLNEVNTYSKLASIIFFIGVFPVLAFYIGVQYQKSKHTPDLTHLKNISALEINTKEIEIVGDTMKLSDEEILWTTYTQTCERQDFCKSINKFYKYNITTGKLMLIYTSPVNSELISTPENNIAIILTLLKKEDSKIIVGTYLSGNNPGPCANTWINGPEYYFFLDLDHIDLGLQKYTIPEDLLKYALQEYQFCYEGLLPDEI